MDINEIRRQFPDSKVLKLFPYQDAYIHSEKPMVAAVTGFAAGKTSALMVKCNQTAEKYPGITLFVVRKAAVHLIRSTQAEWCKLYPHLPVGSDGCCRLPNGSQIWFTHGGDDVSFSAIRGVNAGGFFVDEAHELTLDHILHFRSRLRQDIPGLKVRQLCLCANPDGRNFIYNLFVAAAKTVREIGPHGQMCYETEDGILFTATSFVNDSLTEDYVRNLKSMEQTNPSLFNRMVMCSMEEEVRADNVYPLTLLEQAKKVDFLPRTGFNRRIMGVDPASDSMAGDNTGIIVLKQDGALNWRVEHCQEFIGKDAPWVVGECLRLANQYNCEAVVMDEDGLGRPIGDFARSTSQFEIIPFHNTTYSHDRNKFFGNARTEAAWIVRDMISKNHLKITDEKLLTELNRSFRFKYTTGEQKILISKTVMRSEGIPSPGLADALLYAVSIIEELKTKDARAYDPRWRTQGVGPVAGQRQSQYSSDNWNPFKPDGWNPFER